MSTTTWEVLINLKTKQAKFILIQEDGSTTMTLTAEEAREIGLALVSAADQIKQGVS